MMFDPVRAPSPSVLEHGDVLDGRYRIEGVIKSGGMACVYRATHLLLDQPVAIKVASLSSRGAVERLVTEARAMMPLKSRHVVRVLDLGILPNGTAYIVMELLDGTDLAELLSKGWRPSVGDAVETILQLCAALEEVHDLGMVHLDVKPANLVLTKVRGKPCIKLVDFGVAHLPNVQCSSKSRRVSGSPDYMAPEIMEGGSPEKQADIWGIGVVFYELLAGAVPYDGDSMIAIYLAARKGLPEPPSAARRGIPKGLDAVVLRCLRVSTRQRFADVRELALALAPFRCGRTPSFPDAGTARSLWSTRNGVPMGLLAAALIVAGTFPREHERDDACPASRNAPPLTTPKESRPPRAPTFESAPAVPAPVRLSDTTEPGTERSER